MADSNLPFPRGGTASDNGLAGVTISDTWLNQLEGKTFDVLDDTHGTGATVRLRVVKNDTGSAITPANQLLRFSTGAKDFGRRIAGVSNSKSTVCVPIDDAYGATPTIADDDLFYVVVRGPCSIMTDAADVSLTAHDSVCSDGSTGTLYKTKVIEGEYVVGTIDQDTAAEDTAVLVWVDADLKNPHPAA